MDQSIAKLLGDGTLPPELVQSLQEAFDKKVAEAQKQAEATVREEMARRYEHDKENLVEAMDRMLGDVVQKHVAEQNEAVSRFEGARNRFRRAVKESRKHYRHKLDEGMSKSREVVAEALKREVAKLREQKKALVADKLRSADAMQAMKESLAKMHVERVRKIDEFVVRQVKRELTEFNEDHRSLVQTRVKLVTEGRKKLRDTQARFVKEAARNVEKVVNQSLKREMGQLHEDLERNRQNMFGRRVFEAVAAEYLTSYLAEGTEIRKLQDVLESTKKEAEDNKARLDEALKTGQAASRKVALAEDRAVRAKVMGELLQPLRGEKRTVMEGMLETVKTDALRGTFNKLLPVVLNEAARKPQANAARNAASGDERGPRLLAEAREQRAFNASGKPAGAEDSETATPFARGARSSLVTGDNQRAARMFESVQAEQTDLNDDLAQVIRLAGIQK